MSAVISFGAAWRNELRDALKDPTTPTRAALGEAARKVAQESRRKRRHGELVPLGKDPVTGKFPTGIGRYPTTGLRSPILPALEPDDSPRVPREGRFRSRRERAAEMQERMSKFSAVYNAGWMVRNYYFGPEHRQREAAQKLVAVFLQELGLTDDYEALLFALGDALTCSPHGVPWEA
jgi:hypothetical protein